MRMQIGEEVTRRFPGYVAAIVVARAVAGGPSDRDSTTILRTAERRARERLAGAPPSSLPEIAAWRAAFSAFGCKPSRYPCSAEALLKRVARGDELPAINRLVDVYNAVSIAYALPLGGEDLDRVEGDAILTLATGIERFDGDEPPGPGEVIWRDERGATCRAWNWRQGRRTRIGGASTNVYFLLEAIEPQGAASLEAASRELVSYLDAGAIAVLGLSAEHAIVELI